MPAAERHPLARWRQGRAYSWSEYSSAHPPLCGWRFFVHVTAASNPVACGSHAARFACPPRSDTRLRGGGKAGHIRGANILVLTHPFAGGVFLSTSLRLRTQRRACAALGSHFASKPTGARSQSARAKILVFDEYSSARPPLRWSYFFGHVTADPSRGCASLGGAFVRLDKTGLLR